MKKGLYIVEFRLTLIDEALGYQHPELEKDFNKYLNSLKFLKDYPFSKTLYKDTNFVILEEEKDNRYGVGLFYGDEFNLMDTNIEDGK